MIHKIVKNAAESGADAIVTICPMCQLNLDVYQGYANNLFGTNYEVPVLFFTQVIGLALGLSPKELGFGQEFVSARSVVDKGVATKMARVFERHFCFEWLCEFYFSLFN